MEMTKRNLAFVVALATLGAAWTYPAAAQESDAAVPAAAGEPTAAETPAAQEDQPAEKATDSNAHELQETVVTARRTEHDGFVTRHGTFGFLGEKDAMDVPFTTTNMTQKAIQAFGDPTQPLDSVLSISPSIRATGSILHNDFQHRGFRANGTSLYVNGVPGMFTQFNAPMYVIGKADVVSGPNSGLSGTGTQYESSAAGGLVNLTTKRAGYRDLTRFTLTHGGQSMGGAYLDLSRRFGRDKDWGARLMAEKVDGETAVDGQKVKASSIYINLDHSDAKSKTNFFTGYRQNEVVGGVRWFKLGTGVTRFPSVPKASRSYAFDGMDKESYGWMMIFNHEQKFSKDWNWFVNAGYLKNKLNKNVMPEYSAVTILNDAGDFALKSQTTGTPQRASYLQAGVSGKARTGRAEHTLTLAADRAWRNLGGVFGFSTTSLGTGNIYTGILHQAQMPPTDYVAGTKSKTTIKGISFVDSVDLDKWNLMVGVHHHTADVDSYNRAGHITSSVSSSATTPTLALAYHPTKDTAVYVSHAEYFNVGSVVGSSYVNSGEILPPAKTKQNEIGVKYANKGVLYSLALFDITQANNIAVNNYLRQDGKDRHRGAEFGMAGKIASKWTLAAGLTYMNATNEKTKGGVLDGVAKDGQPRWHGSLMAQYAADDRFSAFGRISYAGSAYILNERFKAPSFTVLDLGMTYKTKLGTVPTTFSLTLYNALNKDYWMVSRDNNNLILSTPRTLALTMSMDL